MTIGEQIRIYRKKVGMTQIELGHRIGMTGKSGISKIETGANSVSWETVLDIAKALGLSPLVFMEQFRQDRYKEFEEYLPYLAEASEETIRNIRYMLNMPPKKILNSTREIV